MYRCWHEWARVLHTGQESKLKVQPATNASSETPSERACLLFHLCTLVAD